jgi:HEAT repeat protein
MRRSPIVLLTLLALPGCFPTTEPSFDSPEPAARNEAIVLAASRGDRAAVPDLVRMLDSDDAATRLLAIRTLDRLTGETFGYDYTDDRPERAAAIDRWTAYAAKHR